MCRSRDGVLTRSRPGSRGTFLSRQESTQGNAPPGAAPATPAGALAHHWSQKVLRQDVRVLTANAQVPSAPLRTYPSPARFARLAFKGQQNQSTSTKVTRRTGRRPGQNEVANGDTFLVALPAPSIILTSHNQSNRSGMRRVRHSHSAGGAKVARHLA